MELSPLKYLRNCPIDLVVIKNFFFPHIHFFIVKCVLVSVKVLDHSYL